jgi:hypothetical protein
VDVPRQPFLWGQLPPLRPDALHRVLLGEKLGASVTAPELAAWARGWMAQHPIGSLLAARPAAADAAPAPQLPAAGWPFLDRAVPAEAVDMLELL